MGEHIPSISNTIHIIVNLMAYNSAENTAKNCGKEKWVIPSFITTDQSTYQLDEDALVIINTKKTVIPVCGMPLELHLEVIFQEKVLCICRHSNSPEVIICSIQKEFIGMCIVYFYIQVDRQVDQHIEVDRQPISHE